MNFSRPFIERPIGTTLLAIGLFLVGLVAYRFLAVASLPTVEFPTISVTASRPGADPVSPDTATWMLIWTAPADARPVTFHVAANAADNDESARGDYVYTTTAVTRPR